MAERQDRGDLDVDVARVEQSLKHLTDEVHGLCADARREHDLLLTARQEMESLRVDVDGLREKVVGMDRDIRPDPHAIAARARAEGDHATEHARFAGHIAEVASARGSVVRFVGWAVMGVLSFGAGMLGTILQKWLGIGGP